MGSDLGNGPDDWGYQQYPAEDAADMRWALSGFAVIRGIVTWITGTDPVLERRRRRLARAQAEGAARYATLEKEAYDRLKLRSESRDGDSPPGGAEA